MKLNFRMRWSMFSGGMPPFSNSKPRCRFFSPSVHARSCPARCWHVAFLKAQHPQVFAGERCRIKYHWCLTRQGSCSSTAAASFNCCCQEAVSNSKINMSHFHLRRLQTHCFDELLPPGPPKPFAHDRSSNTLLGSIDNGYLVVLECNKAWGPTPNRAAQTFILARVCVCVCMLVCMCVCVRE